jgi:hypothetical protein
VTFRLDAEIGIHKLEVKRSVTAFLPHYYMAVKNDDFLKSLGSSCHSDVLNEGFFRFMNLLIHPLLVFELVHSNVH